MNLGLDIGMMFVGIWCCKAFNAEAVLPAHKIKQAGVKIPLLNYRAMGSKQVKGRKKTVT